ncbi:MAG: class I SAM-dependent methyltransferase, partial [Endozoicomonas sp.]
MPSISARNIAKTTMTLLLRRSTFLNNLIKVSLLASLWVTLSWADGYTLSNQWKLARERLELLEETQNPGTFRFLESLNIQPGWQCLDVGSGLGGVAQWLADKVGEKGRVTATDIDIRFLKEKQSGHLRV